MAQYFGHPHRLKLLHFLHAEFRHHLHQVSWAKVDGETVKPSTKLSWDYHFMFMGSIKNGVWMIFNNDVYNHHLTNLTIGESIYIYSGSMMVQFMGFLVRFSWDFMGAHGIFQWDPCPLGSAPWALLLTSALRREALGGCSWGVHWVWGVTLYSNLWVIKYPLINLIISTYFNCTPKIPQVYPSISILSSRLI